MFVVNTSDGIDSDGLPHSVLIDHVRGKLNVPQLLYIQRYRVASAVNPEKVPGLMYVIELESNALAVVKDGIKPNFK